ncbi:MAG TPA: hypothetical protein DHN29_02425, partial [Cytophagales bacterium]|nr:hypothetical protein [Cytophagales bacterium]
MTYSSTATIMSRKNVIRFTFFLAFLILSFKGISQNFSLEFSGDDFLTTPANSSGILNGDNSWTIEFWMQSPPGGATPVVLTPADYFVFNADGSIVFVSPSGDVESVADVFPRDNSWFHFTIASEAAQAHIYINGISVATVTNPSTTLSGLGAESFDIGSSISASTFRIDEFRMWSNFSDTSTVSSQMNSELVGNEVGLVAYYNFNEGSGTVVNDLSVNSNNGSIAGTPIWSVDVPFAPNNNALDFDGIDDYVSVPFASPSIYTTEAWVKFDTLLGHMTISRWTQDADPAQVSQWMKLDATGTYFEHYIFDGAVKQVTGTTPVNVGLWYHVAVTAENGGLMKLYVNGVEEGTPLSVTTLWAVGDQLRLGGGADVHPVFDGQIDEFRYWNTVRTKDQIINNAYSSLTSGAGLVASYDFNQGVPESDNSGLTTLPDISGNGNNGTLNGPFALLGTSSNWVTSGAMSSDIFPPTILSAFTDDTDLDGQIDLITVNFSEDLDAASVADVPAEFTVAGYTISGSAMNGSNSVDIILTPSGSPDTDQTPVVTLLAATLQDLNGVGNVTESITPADGAGPVMVSATTFDNDVNGQIDGINITMSESTNFGASLNSSGGDFLVSGFTPNFASSFNATQMAVTFPESGSSDTDVTPTITLLSGALEDLNGVVNGGNQLLTTQDLAPPVLISSSPADEDTVFAIFNDIILNFSEPVSEGSGNILIVDTGDSTGTQTITVPSAAVTGFGTSIIAINPISDLDPSETYALQIGSTVFVDSSSVFYAGIGDLTTLNFTTDVLPNYALDFDGTDDHIRAGNNASLQFERTDAFTIEAWIKTSFSSGQMIAGNMLQGGTYQGYGLLMGAGGVDGIYFTLVNTAGTNDFEVYGGGNLYDDTWHHIAVSYDGSSAASGVSLYVDGVAQSLTVNKDSLTGSIVNGNEFRIAARDNLTNSALGSPFHGQMDEVRVWNTSRTIEQVNVFKDVELNGGEPNLVGYWNFSNGPGNDTIPDYSVSGNTGTMINMDNVTDYVAATHGVAPAGPLDTIAPTPFITSSSATTDSPIIIDIDFGESVVGFDETDLIVTNALVHNFTNIDGQLYSADLYPDSVGTLTVDIPSAAAFDYTGNISDSTTQFSILANSPNNALDFDKLTGYVDIGDVVDFPGDFTWEAFIYPTTVSGYNNIISKHNGGSEPLLTISSAGALTWYYGGDQSFGGTIVPNQWYHVAAVRSSGSLQLYLDGVAVGTPFVNSDDLTNATSLQFGTQANSTSNDFDGLIDEVRIWSDARTPTELQDHRYNKLVGNEDGLLAYYRFDETAGTTLPDLSGNGFDGVLSGGMDGTDWVTSTAMTPPSSVTEDFESFTFNGTLMNLTTGDYHFAQPLSNNFQSYSGSYAAEFSYGSMVTPPMDGDSTLVSFYYSATGTGEAHFQIERSTNGGEYVVFAQPTATSTTFNQYNFVLDEGVDSSVRLRISSLDLVSDQNVIIDDLSFTPYAGDSIYAPVLVVQSINALDSSANIDVQVDLYSDVYHVISTSPSIPTPDQLKAGLDGDSTAAVYTNSYGGLTGTSNLNTPNVLVPGQQYYSFWVAEDWSNPGLYSAVDSAGFTTPVTPRVAISTIPVSSDTLHAGSFDNLIYKLKFSIYDAPANVEGFVLEPDSAAVYSQSDFATFNFYESVGVDNFDSASYIGSEPFFSSHPSGMPDGFVGYLWSNLYNPGQNVYIYVTADMSDTIASDGTFAFLAPLADSYFGFQGATQLDSGLTASSLFYIKSSSPSLNIDFFEDGYTLYDDTYITGYVSDPTATVEISLDYGSTLSFASVDSAGYWSYDLSSDPNYFGDGFYNVDVVATDSLLNEAFFYGSITLESGSSRITEDFETLGLINYDDTLTLAGGVWEFFGAYGNDGPVFSGSTSLGLNFATPGYLVTPEFDGGDSITFEYYAIDATFTISSSIDGGGFNVVEVVTDTSGFFNHYVYFPDTVGSKVQLRIDMDDFASSSNLILDDFTFVPVSGGVAPVLSGLVPYPYDNYLDVDITVDVLSDIYYVITQSATMPTISQIVSETDEYDSLAETSGKITSVSGFGNFGLGSYAWGANDVLLTEGNTYNLYMVAESDSGVYSNVVFAEFSTNLGYYGLDEISETFDSFSGTLDVLSSGDYLFETDSFTLSNATVTSDSSLTVGGYGNAIQLSDGGDYIQTFELIDVFRFGFDFSSSTGNQVYAQVSVSTDGVSFNPIFNASTYSTDYWDKGFTFDSLFTGYIRIAAERSGSSTLLIDEFYYQTTPTYGVVNISSDSLSSDTLSASSSNNLVYKLLFTVPDSSSVVSTEGFFLTPNDSSANYSPTDFLSFDLYQSFGVDNLDSASYVASGGFIYGDSSISDGNVGFWYGWDYYASDSVYLYVTANMSDSVSEGGLFYFEAPAAIGNFAFTNTSINDYGITQGGTFVMSNSVQTGPTISGDSVISIDENNTIVGSYSADKTVSWSLGGVDQSSLNIGADGTVSFISAPDFEAPVDANNDNIYDVIVIAVDLLGNYDSLNASITVLDVNEDSLVVLGDSIVTINENTTFVGSYTASSPVSWTISMVKSS